jgi:hypothetical protein
MNSTAEQVTKLVDDQNISSLKLWENLEYFWNHSDSQNSTDLSLPPGLFESTVEFSRRTAILTKIVHCLRIENLFSSGGEWKDVQKYLTPKDGREDVVFDHPGVSPLTDRKAIMGEGMYQIRLYQAVRDYAQDRSTYYTAVAGAIATFLLPIFYAVFGACLFTLRQMLQQTTVSDPGRGTRWIIALILGTAISVFQPLLSNEIVLPPLAIAFLVGYSSDIFVSAIDALVAKLTLVVPNRSGSGG